MGGFQFIFVCGQSASFLGGHGGGADVGCHLCQALCCGCGWGCGWVVVGGWLKKRMDVTHCDIWSMFKFAREILTCMISCDDLRLVPWKSTRCSMDWNFFFKESGQTLYGITRHNNTNPIPIIFCADSAGMSNSMISLAEFQDSSQILGGIPGGK